LGGHELGVFQRSAGLHVGATAGCRSGELGMKVKIGCHTFRATVVTDEITLDEVERITI
jgi:hypothetical protein